MSQHVKTTVACDADHADDEEVEEEDDSEDEMVEEDEEEEEVVIESEEDDINDKEFELQTSYIKSNTESDDYIEDEEEEDYDTEEEDEEEEDEVDTEEEVDQEKEEEEEEDEEDEEEEEAEVQFQGNENDETGEEESEDLAEEENEDEELMATFVGRTNPNFLTLQKYRAEGHWRVCFNLKAGKSMLFDMCIEKVGKVMHTLMKNLLKELLGGSCAVTRHKSVNHKNLGKVVLLASQQHQMKTAMSNQVLSKFMTPPNDRKGKLLQSGTSMHVKHHLKRALLPTPASQKRPQSLPINLPQTRIRRRIKQQVHKPNAVPTFLLRRLFQKTCGSKTR